MEKGKEWQRKHFYELLEKQTDSLDERRKGTFVIDTHKYQSILDALRLKKGEACAKGGHFKQWATNNFLIVSESEGAPDCLYGFKSQRLPLPVAKKEDIFDILDR